MDSWSDAGIIDPEIEWVDSDSKKHGIDTLFQTVLIFAEIIDEIEFYKTELDDLYKLGLWSDTIEQYSRWLEYIEYKIESQSENAMTRSMIINFKIEIIRFRDDFDKFAAKIGWYGDGDYNEE